MSVDALKADIEQIYALTDDLLSGKHGRLPRPIAPLVMQVNRTTRHARKLTQQELTPELIRELHSYIPTMPVLNATLEKLEDPTHHAIFEQVVKTAQSAHLNAQALLE